MTPRSLIWLGLIVGSMLGGFLPTVLWGAGPFSVSSVLGSFVGGGLGIWFGFKTGHG